MIIDIPFELNETVYIIIKNIDYITGEWVPPDYSLGGDIDGPFDRGHYERITKITFKVKETKFKFGLLDKYNINKIYKNRESAEWALLLKEKENRNGKIS